MEQHFEEEALGLDHAIGFESDDFQNQAQKVCANDGGTESDDGSDALPVASSDSLERDSALLWPQSYRRSVNMYLSVTPPSTCYVRGNSLLPSADSKSLLSANGSLFETLISSSGPGEEALSPSMLLEKKSSICESMASLSELPSLNERCSYAQSVVNALNVLCGIGILSMPYAIKEGGWLSLMLLFLLGAITRYTGTLLKRCLDSSSQLKTYPDIGQAAFGLTGRICISAILYAELYSSCVEMLIMMSDNLSAAFPNAQLNIAGIGLDSYQIFALASTLVILPTVWLRNLNLLSYISAGGIVILAIVVLCLLSVGLSSETGFHPGGKLLDLTHLPFTVGIYGFCYGGHSVFPNIYSSMKEPSRFPSVLTVSFLCNALVHAGVAVLGFLMFGEATSSAFTLNLPPGMIASKIAGWATIMVPVAKFGLTMTPVALSLEELLPPSWLGLWPVTILFRTCLTISTLVVALAVPYFGSVMSLIGSSLVMLISIILPCACYMTIHKRRLAMVKIVVCSTTMLVGVVCAIVGTYSAVASMAGK